MFGFGRQEAVGRHVGTMIVPETSRDGHRAHWDALRADGAPAEWSFEALTMLARGEEVPVGVRVTRIGAESPHFILSMRDKSGREPTEQAHRQLRTIVDSAEDAMATLSLDGMVTS
jgi:PAS domain S-box-containing protein